MNLFARRSPMAFQDRYEGGLILGRLLSPYATDPRVVVLALPRGGVPVAFQIARALQAPLDIFLVRKLGAPQQSELALGAIASGGVRVLNQGIVDELGISPGEIETIAAREARELDRRESAYRGERSGLSLSGRTVILVDDGLATGATMRAAVAALRLHQPGKIVVAVPVAEAEAGAELRRMVDDVVAALTPVPFIAVGRWYRDFSPTMDREIQDLLGQQARSAASVMPAIAQ